MHTTGMQGISIHVYAPGYSGNSLIWTPIFKWSYCKWCFSLKSNPTFSHNTSCWGEPAMQNACVCLCVAIYWNLNWVNWFQICTHAKTNSCSVNSMLMKVRLWTMTDKGRLLTDGTVKSRTVVAFAPGKGHANDTHKCQRFSSWLYCEV